MDEMREIVTMEQVNRWFLLLAIVAPILGLLLGAVAGRRQGRATWGALGGLFIGLLGPLNLLLWKVYNALTDQMGLDTVKNLLVQLGLFVVLGVAAGLVLSRLAKMRAEDARFADWRNGPGSDLDSGGSAPVAAGVGGTPSPGAAGAAKTFDEALQPPRDL